MRAPRVILVSGPSGVGKSTVARRLAEQSPEARAVHLPSDDFYAYVRKGYLEPWRTEAHDQNITVMNTLVASATAYAAGGYEVVVDGVIGPWFFAPWLAAARAHPLDLRLVILLPDEARTVARAQARTTSDALTEAAVLRGIWRGFRDASLPEGHVLDTSEQDAAATVGTVRLAITEGRFRLV
ncbi:AAA family ATPase [Myxococcus fulvus]|uniref:AAA family ATPase n=1 Tax=Myxococcus fulvus TaxID=33 RepID=UPI0020BFC04B|nr:AAA family ATPase [Myxococcus fulvus]MCK8503273.1 ATP-binding protein [Myxococcus fulvus]